MAETRDFGAATHITAEALGQPGQRRFRLRAINAESDALVIWLEKEQLSAVGEAIESVLDNEGYHYERQPLDDADPEPVFPLDADVELRAGQMQMGLDREARRIVVLAAEVSEPGAPEGDSVSLSVGYRHAHELRSQIAAVLTAGRKPCPLCTAPMDPAGHVCVKSNGHHPH